VLAAIEIHTVSLSPDPPRYLRAMILISTKSVVMLESVGGGFIHVPVVARVLALSRVEP
jgi:hypothetical protein